MALHHTLLTAGVSTINQILLKTAQQSEIENVQKVPSI